MSQTTRVESATGRGNGNRAPAGLTVRDAAFEVMRRHGLTTIFGNPGSTEIPFLTDLPTDLTLRARSARGLGGRDGDRLRTGPRRAGVRQPPHGGRSRQRDQRDRQRPRLPRPARDRGRPAGSPADRVRAVPHRASARAAGRRVSGLASAAGPRPGRARRDRARLPRGGGGARPGAGRGADGRLARAGRRARRRGPGRVLRPHSVAPPRFANSRTCSPAAECAGAGRRARPRPEDWDAVVALAERLALPGLAGAVQPPRRLPAGSRAVRRPPALAAAADARCRWPATTSC